MIGSLYFDLLESNERKATVSIRPVTNNTYLYEITASEDKTRGTVNTDTTNPLALVAKVLADLFSPDL